MQKIAIIGISCLLPDAKTPDEYWQNLINGKDSISRMEFSLLGRDPADYFDPSKQDKDKYYSDYGGFIHDFEFDPTGYKLPADFLKDLDESFTWSLYAAKEALKDAGYLNKTKLLAQCGIILGNLSFPTKQSQKKFMSFYAKAMETPLKELFQDPSFTLENPVPEDTHFTNGRISGLPATIISQALGLGAGHLSLDAACAASLYSIKTACSYLISGKANLMLAGGVSVSEPWFVSTGFSVFQALATENHNMPLDQKSEGLIAGQGAGMIVLKRYEDAIQDNDQIYGIIRGAGISNDGRGKFVLAPNSKGQVHCFERAYGQANIKPESINYIEMHATGTPVGDVAELNSMESFFGDHAKNLKIGSVKSNFGHLLSTAGVASLIKVLLALKHETLPPTIKVNDPVSSSSGQLGQKQIITKTTAWPQTKEARMIGISAFGFGGTNAHLIIEEHLKRRSGVPEAAPRRSGAPEASPEKLSKLSIVGMASYFGGCHNLNEMDNLIYQSKVLATELPSHRWKGIERQTELLKAYGFEKGVPLGNYLDSFNFDFLHYKIPPLQDAPLLPQQLLILKVADEAIQDAGLEKGANVATIIAMESDLTIHQFRGRVDLGHYLRETLEKQNSTLSSSEIDDLVNQIKDSFHNTGDINQITSFIGNIMATRVNSLWDFNGPAFTVSSEENSSFKALEIAQLFLSHNEVDAVVVGAVDFSGGLEHVLLKNQKYPASLSEESLSFSKSNSGWFVGEGAGAVVLKREETAKQDQNGMPHHRTYATIDSLVNRSGLTSATVQQTCQEALDKAEITTQDIEYLEAHASGYSDENKIEIEGLLQVYSSEDQEKHCAIGSVKSNIGHTFAASGLASLIKTSLCLYHRYIPGIPQWNSPDQIDQWEKGGFYFPNESRPWLKDEKDQIRRAAINSLGQDGACGHLILSEATNSESGMPPNRHTFYFQQADLRMFPIQGHSIEDIEQGLQQLQSKTQPSNFENVASEQFDVYEKQSNAPYALVLLAHDHQELLQEIQLAQSGCRPAFQTGKPWNSPRGSYLTPHPLAQKGKIAFVYPGGYNSYVGMAQNLFYMFPDLFEAAKLQTHQIKTYLRPWTLYPRTLEKTTEEQVQQLQSEFKDDAIAMFETGILLSTLYTRVVRDCLGIEPQAVFGNSMGELSMMFSMGGWKSPETMSEKLRKLPTFQNLLVGPMDLARKAWQLPPSKGKDDIIWSTFSLQISPEKAKPIIDKEDRVYLTMINTPNDIVIAGDPEGCKRVCHHLDCTAFEIQVGDIIHTELLKADYDNLLDIHTQEVFPQEGIDFYAAHNYGKTELTTKIIAENITSFYDKCLDFPKLVQQVYDDGARIFIELGARSNCTTWIKDCLKDQEHLAVSVDHKKQDEQTTWLQFIAKLLSHRVPMNLSPYFSDSTMRTTGTIKRQTPVVIGKKPFADVLLTDNNLKKFGRSPQIDPPLENQSLPPEPQAKPLPNPSFTPLQNIEAPSTLLPLQHLIQNSQIEQTVQIEFLKLRQQSLQKWASLMSHEMQAPMVDGSIPIISPSNEKISESSKQFFPTRYTQPETIIWNTSDLLEFAQGKISNVFGKDYEIIDSYRRRVMLPMSPFLLAHRVTKINAKMGEFKPSTLSTEYDIPHNSWHSIDGSITTAICCESGQCDLLLISYLGVDFENSGEKVYRLTDASFTYYENFPTEGETLRYDISIDSFARASGNLLFFFSYNCSVGDRLIMQMHGGIAGFYSDKDLASGGGIIRSKKELEDKKNVTKRSFTPLLPCAKTSFDHQDLINVIYGYLDQCFGVGYNQNGKNPSLHFPSEQMLMLDHIISVDPKGAAWGLGEVWASKTLKPDDWYFTCHFKDDEVFPGNLNVEGAAQIVQFFMLYLGLQTQTQKARFQPIKNRAQVARCRGQITPKDKLLKYHLEVTDIGLTPKPYVIGNVELYLNDVLILDVKNMGMELSEDSEMGKPKENTELTAQFTPTPNPMFNEVHVSEFATGKVHNCFGPDFQIYENRRAPRTPNGYLQLISRVNELNGTRGKFDEVSSLTSEYDVPPDVWFYEQNSFPVTPYSMIMELALQPNGFLCTSMGSPLLFPDIDFSFRNLDGEGDLLMDIDLRGKTVVNRSQLLTTSPFGGNIIQRFTFELLCENQLFYKGIAVFGYHSQEALANQQGLDKGRKTEPWYIKEKASTSDSIEINVHRSVNQSQYYGQKSDKPHYRLPGGMLELLDKLHIFPHGGLHQKGYVFASKAIDPTNWFYPCHFYEDPVMPGSLGVEAMLESLQYYALSQQLGHSFVNPHFTHVLGKTKWIYRGQIVQTVKRMTLEVHIKEINFHENSIDIIADGNLWRDDLRIYEVHNLRLRIQDQPS